MLLTLDRGNTTLDGCLWGTDGAVLLRRRFDGRTSGHRGGDVPDAAQREFLHQMVQAPGSEGGVGARTDAIGVTVVAGGLDIATRSLADMGIRLHRVPGDLPVPMALDYDPPAALGADRWLGALGAVSAAGAPVIVVDCGTATTVNAVDGEGVFRGGAIGPGLDGIASSMAVCTPGLPAVDWAALEPMPARTSAGAVAGGVVLGWCGMVERLVAEVLASPAMGGGTTGIRSGGVPLLVTGGRAELLARHSTLALRLADDLVHRGLRAVWQGASGMGAQCRS